MKIKTLSILFISCILITSCNHADSVEANATVESIESVETITEIEEPTTIEEIESTVEIRENETVVEESTVEIETTIEEVYSAEQPTVDTTGKTNVVVQDGITYWDGITDEEIAQQIIDQFERENGIGKYAPGSDPSNYIMPEGVEHGTPGDPSQDGQYHLGQGGELPPELQGRHTN